MNRQNGRVAVLPRLCARAIGVSVLLGGQALVGQGLGRTLTGTVQDRHHEPLKGAVVQVEDEGSNGVVSYLTDRQGQFSFKRLSGDSDYRVWATYRGQRSHTKEMSHFDSKRDKVMKFVIVLP